MSVYVLVAIFRKHLKQEASLYTSIQVFAVTAFEKVPMKSVLSEALYR